MLFSTKLVTVLVAAASIAPVLAAPFEELLRRDVNDALELMAREYGAHHSSHPHPHHPHRFHHRPQHAHHPHHRPQHHHPQHALHHHRPQHPHHRPGHSRVQAREPKHHGLKAHHGHKGHKGRKHGHKGRKHGHKGHKGGKHHAREEEELFARDLFELVARSGLLDELD